MTITTAAPTYVVLLAELIHQAPPDCDRCCNQPLVEIYADGVFIISAGHDAHCPESNYTQRLVDEPPC